MERPGSSDNTPTTHIQRYYDTICDSDLQARFHDLDSTTCSEWLVDKVTSRKTQNFIVDFSDDAAWCSFDLPTLLIEKLLETSRPEALSTRWINVWYPHTNVPLLEMLAQHYDFSPRLLALMASDPRRPRRSQSDTLPHHTSASKQDQHGITIMHDEEGMNQAPELASLLSSDSVGTINLYRVIDDMWHYSSVDSGRGYVCIGFNSLYGATQANTDTGDDILPYCTRLWTWLVLCEDNTVISINEDPFPFSNGSIDSVRQCVLSRSRRNIVDVFSSLSMVEQHPSTPQNPMSILPIRTRLGAISEETMPRQSDSPGLLFYCLFENWRNSYALIIRRESRYGVELNKLRAEMFEVPKLCHIDRLDSIGKELGALKRHFESYMRLIDRLLEPHAPTAASFRNLGIDRVDSQTSVSTVRSITTAMASSLGVGLTLAVRVRFERLKDLIDLHALREVEDYIKQKDSLVAMNLQLIAIKESLDVERLTQITLFLTKLTVIFLPVSLMTAYFSVPLKDMLYTVEEFWISFVAILLLSWCALFIFGVLSGSVQTMTAWKTGLKELQRAGTWVRKRDR